MAKKPRRLQLENALLLLESLSMEEAIALAKRYGYATYGVSVQLNNALVTVEREENEKLDKADDATRQRR